MLQFALVFGNQKSADEAVAALAMEGFDVELQPQADNDSWVVSAVPQTTVRVEATSEQIRVIAAEYGGEYLGHGGVLTVGLGNPGSGV